MNPHPESSPTSPQTFVLYHGPHCADGFGAAFAAWCALGDTATYLPVNYGQPFPEIPDGARVFIVDFSWPDDAVARIALLALAARCELVVIDHHQTAAEALAGLPFAHFDNTKSGAVLAWEYFRGLDEPGNCFGEVPELLCYVQDRDLWRWEMPDSREVSAALGIEPRTFTRWNQLLHASDSEMESLIEKGRAVLATHAALIDSICRQAHVHHLKVFGEDDPETLFAVNTPVLQSEVCHELLQRFPTLQIVAAYFDKDWCTRVWSLRSRPGCDCSVLAKRMGGGGHAQAAGFQTILA